MKHTKTFEDYIATNSSEDLVNESGYVEAMNPTELDEAIDKLVAVWTEWKKGPATKSSDINPAKKDLLSYIEKQLK